MSVQGNVVHFQTLFAPKDFPFPLFPVIFTCVLVLSPRDACSTFHYPHWWRGLATPPPVSLAPREEFRPSGLPPRLKLFRSLFPPDGNSRLFVLLLDFMTSIVKKKMNALDLIRTVAGGGGRRVTP